MTRLALFAVWTALLTYAIVNQSKTAALLCLPLVVVDMALEFHERRRKV